MRYLMLIFSLTVTCCSLSTIRALPHSLRSLQYHGKDIHPDSMRTKKWYSWDDSQLRTKKWYSWGDSQVPDMTKKWYDWQDSGPSEIRKRAAHFNGRDFIRSVLNRFEWKFTRL